MELQDLDQGIPQLAAGHHLIHKAVLQLELAARNPAFSRPSVVLLEQIFTIDKERISSFMGMTSAWEMAQIEKALKCSLALDRENMNPERGNLFG